MARTRESRNRNEMKGQAFDLRSHAFHQPEKLWPSPHPLAGVLDAQEYSQAHLPNFISHGLPAQTQTPDGWASSQVPLTPTAQRLSWHYGPHLIPHFPSSYEGLVMTPTPRPLLPAHSSHTSPLPEVLLDFDSVAQQSSCT